MCIYSWVRGGNLKPYPYPDQPTAPLPPHAAVIIFPTYVCRLCPVTCLPLCLPTSIVLICPCTVFNFFGNIITIYFWSLNLQSWFTYYVVRYIDHKLSIKHVNEISLSCTVNAYAN